MTAIIEQKWTELRRARRAADSALSLSVRLMRDGDLASASRAALLAERLARLDVAAEQRKRAAKAARRRAEDALAAAEKQVSLLQAAKQPPPPPSAPTHEFTPEVLAAMAKRRRQAQLALGLPVSA